MPRWKQCAKTHKLIPIDEAAARHDGVLIKDFEPFKSPLDGEVITTRKQYEDHMRKHNVVPAQEFTQEWYDKKARERARFYQGEHTTAESFARKQQIHEIIAKAERDAGY